MKKLTLTLLALLALTLTRGAKSLRRRKDNRYKRDYNK